MKAMSRNMATSLLDYDKITLRDEEPQAIPDENIVFTPNKLSENGTGTRMVLKDIRKNINTIYYYLINRLVRNFNIESDKLRTDNSLVFWPLANMSTNDFKSPWSAFSKASM